jgi:hypothetical protein
VEGEAGAADGSPAVLRSDGDGRCLAVIKNGDPAYFAGNYTVQMPTALSIS